MKLSVVYSLPVSFSWKNLHTGLQTLRKKMVRNFIFISWEKQDGSEILREHNMVVMLLFFEQGYEIHAPKDYFKMILQWSFGEGMIMKLYLKPVSWDTKCVCVCVWPFPLYLKSIGVFPKSMIFTSLCGKQTSKLWILGTSDFMTTSDS